MLRFLPMFAALSLSATLLSAGCEDAEVPSTSSDDTDDDSASGLPDDDADDDQSGDDDDALAADDVDAGAARGRADGGKVTPPQGRSDGGKGSAASGGAIDAALKDAAHTSDDVASDAATASGDGGFIPPWMTRADLGKGDGKDVITIGDSWMTGALGGAGIEAALDRAGTKYRHYGRSATTLLSGVIPGQYDTAKSRDPKITTVIMTGGGNDIMFDPGSCSTAERCAEKTATITAALDKLWTKMANDGVKDVIYIQYSDDAGSTPQSARDGERKPVPICVTGRISCHSMPTTDLVMGSLSDGIHPTSAANDRIAKGLLKLMEQRGIRR